MLGFASKIRRASSYADGAVKGESTSIAAAVVLVFSCAGSDTVVVRWEGSTDVAGLFA